MNIFRTIAKAVKRMFSADRIKKYYDRDTALSTEMAAASERWYSMYCGQADWIKDGIVSLRLEQGTAREFANTALNEMTVSVSSERLDALLRRAIKDINQNFQKGLAVGAMVIKPLGTGTSQVQYITQNEFVPLRYDADGRLADVIFPDIERIKEGLYYIRLERHTLDTNGLTITNRAFRSSRPDSIDTEIPLSVLERWSSIPGEIRYPMMQRQAFGYYVNPLANTIDGSQAGMSIFAPAEKLYRRADIQSDRIDWEYDSGERRIHVDTQAVKSGEKSESVLDARLYKGLDLMQSGEELYREYSPQLRDEGYIKGLNEIKREIEFAVGLSYGDLSDPQAVEKTAAEVISSKQRKYDTVTAIQMSLKNCLEDLTYALAFYNSMAASGYEFTCTFEDSILSTDEERRKLDREEVAMGVMSRLEYRMKWYGEDEKTAGKNLPQQAEVIM